MLIHAAAAATAHTRPARARVAFQSFYARVPPTSQPEFVGFLCATLVAADRAAPATAMAQSQPISPGHMLCMVAPCQSTQNLSRLRTTATRLRPPSEDQV